MSDEAKVYSVADTVWYRVVQIFQEAMLTGVDAVDLMRQIRVELIDGELQPTEEYLSQVVEGHKRMIAEAERLKAEQPAEEALGQAINVGVGLVKDDDDAEPN